MRIGDLQAQFNAALGGLLPQTNNVIGLAVSGGGDSIALLHLIARSGLVDRSKLRVFTVDHRLRAASADEAKFVAALCNRLGFAHQTLVWDAPDASQSRARQARHRLLAEALGADAGTLILTGHTLSDNVESFLIRARASSGWYGLAGMGRLAVSPVWPEGAGLSIGRPMLQMQREDIRAWLSRIGETWCDDPSNENDAYERVRARNLLETNAALTARIAQIQHKLGCLRAARDAALATWLDTAKLDGERLELSIPSTLSEEALAQGLSLACMAVSGSSRPPRTQRSLSAAAKIKQGSSAQTLTLGGAVIRLRKEKLILQRETNRLAIGKSIQPCLRLQHICTGLRGSSRE